MITLNQIKKENQILAHCEKSLALNKLKKRRADTRNKIELGGLVIKSGMAVHNKYILLGALKHAFNLLEHNIYYIDKFNQIAKETF